MNEKLLDKIKEILEMARNARDIDSKDEKNIEIDGIIWQCNQILIDHQIQQALRRQNE